METEKAEQLQKDIEQLNRAYTAGTEKITTVQKELSTEQKIANFNNLLTNNIIPSYRHLIESELGFMYERHDIMEHQKTSRVNIQTKIP